VRRREETTGPPVELDLDAALWWLVDHGATLDELYEYWEAHEDFDAVVDLRLGAVET
jgi:hypothetical protein